jgi:hypothetical protein
MPNTGINKPKPPHLSIKCDQDRSWSTPIRWSSFSMSKLLDNGSCSLRWLFELSWRDIVWFMMELEASRSSCVEPTMPSFLSPSSLCDCCSFLLSSLRDRPLQNPTLSPWATKFYLHSGKHYLLPPYTEACGYRRRKLVVAVRSSKPALQQWNLKLLATRKRFCLASA